MLTSQPHYYRVHRLVVLKLVRHLLLNALRSEGVELTCQGGIGSGGASGHPCTRRAMMMMVVMMKLVFSGRMLVSSCDGTARQAPMGVAVGANMTSTIATGGWAFQDGLMHRQD